MTRIDHTAGGPGHAAGPSPANRAWVRGGSPPHSPTRADGTPRGLRTNRFVFAADFLLALRGRRVRRAIYLASVFACASSLAWTAARADPALAATDPPATLHSPYVSAERAREAGIVARENPVPRPTLLQREPTGEGPTYASGDQPSDPSLTFEDVSQPDPRQQEEFAQIGQPDASTSGGSPPITFEDLEGPPPADFPATQPEEPAVTESFPPTASVPPSPESSGGGDEPLSPSARPGPTGDVIPTPELVPEGELENPPAEEPEGASEEDLAVGEAPSATDEAAEQGPQDTSGKVPPQTSTEVAEDPPVEEASSDEGATGEPPTGDLREKGGATDDQYASEDGPPSATILPLVAHADDDAPDGEDPPSPSQQPGGQQPEEQQPRPDPPPAGEDDGPSDDQYGADQGDEIPTVGETPPTPDPDPPADEAPSPEYPEEPAPDDGAQRPDVPGQTGNAGQGGQDTPPMPDDVEGDLKGRLDVILARVRVGGVIEEADVSGGAPTPQEQELLRSLNEANTAVEMARELAVKAPEAREERERVRERARSAVEEAGWATVQATRNETPDGGTADDTEGGTGNGADVPSGEAPPQPAPEPQTPPRGSNPTDEPTTQSPPAEAPPEEGTDDAERSRVAGSSGDESSEGEGTSGAPAKEDADGRPAPATAEPPITDPGVELKTPQPRIPYTPPFADPGADRDDEKPASQDGNGGR